MVCKYFDFTLVHMLAMILRKLIINNPLIFILLNQNNPCFEGLSQNLPVSTMLLIGNLSRLSFISNLYSSLLDGHQVALRSSVLIDFVENIPPTCHEDGWSHDLRRSILAELRIVSNRYTLQLLLTPAETFFR